jgi:hypothetical protein
VSYPETVLATIESGGETWEIVRREFSGIRVRHGEYVEWPVLVPHLNLVRFAPYTFNGEHSLTNPNTDIPAEVQLKVRDLIRG